MGRTYQSVGVDIAAGDEAVERIKALVRSTYRAEVIGDVGGFGGLFDFPAHQFGRPVLVSSTDGVGTKSYIAAATGRFDTIGLDLVAMCVDDIVCQGAEPLFLLDYISVGQLDGAQIEQLVHGVAAGCRQAGCALIGGEMAVHPGAMDPGEFDLVGCAVGVVEHDRLIAGEHVRPGDAVIGLPSPGLRCNGYSLARRVLLDDAGRSLDAPAYDGATHTLADELLEPSIVYAPAILALRARVEIRAAAHITGGGLAGNLSRVLPETVDVVLDSRSWEVPRVFTEIQRLGDISQDEMRKVFNLGIGMVVIVAPDDVSSALGVLRDRGLRASVIGTAEPGTGDVRITS